MPYRYLNPSVPELIAANIDVHLFCVCGHCVCMGPEDFARWPTASLHGIARKLRCLKCDRLGDIPDVRITAVSARMMSHPTVPAPSRDTGSGPIQTTHPRRSRRRTRRVKLLKQPKLRYYLSHDERDELVQIGEASRRYRAN